MLATAVPTEAPRPAPRRRPAGNEERRVRVRIDLGERSVEVRRGPERRRFVLIVEPTVGGWVELDQGQVGRALTVANLIGHCLCDPGAGKAIRGLTEEGIDRAGVRARAAGQRSRRAVSGLETEHLVEERRAWHAVSRGLGSELGKSGGERAPNLPLRELFLERLAAGGPGLAEVAQRLGWLTRRRSGELTAETSRVGRTLGLEPTLSHKGRRRPSWATSVSVAMAAELCLGLGVDPHEVDAGWSVEVEILGAPTDPDPTPSPRALRAAPPVASSLLGSYRDRAGRRRVVALHELGERGALLVDQGAGGRGRLVAALDLDEGPIEARAAAREYLSDPRRGSSALCRELTDQEADLVAEADRRSAPTDSNDHERAAA